MVLAQMQMISEQQANDLILEMKALIADLQNQISTQDSYIKELQQEMSDMHDKYYDC